jgi:hypothetical protein
MDFGDDVELTNSKLGFWLVSDEFVFCLGEGVDIS